MSDQAHEKPLLELMRNVPKDFRAEWEIQWFDDGMPSGHAIAPVGLYLHRAADEIERLTACIEHHQAVEADQERAIERLQSELGVWKANAETNLGEVERLQAAVDGLRQNRDLAYEKEKRLRAALERAVAYFDKPHLRTLHCSDEFDAAVDGMKKVLRDE